MNQEYLKIIEDGKLDKFLQNNKFDPEIINEFIKYVITREEVKYPLLKEILISIIDTKNFVDISSIFLSILSCEYDLVDLVESCNKLSVNIIQKFKGSPLLVKILNLLVDISLDLYNREWYYECTIILYTFSLFVTNCGISNKALFIRYYDILSKIFLRSNNFHSALNALAFIDQRLIDDKLVGLCTYKNEGNKYSQLLLKMKLQHFEGEYRGYDENWDFYVKNINSRMPVKKETLKFISFLSRNNLSFEREGNEIIIGEYKYQSVDSKIHDIIDLYTIKEDREVKREIKKTEGEIKKTERDIKKTERDIKRKELKFTDNFTTRKAKYNIYCEILKDTFKDKVLDYDLRNKIRKEKHEEYNKILREKKEYFLGFKEDLEALYNRLLTQKKQMKTSYVRPEIQSKGKSWRDEIDDPLIPYKPITRKKEEIHSDRKIFTYGETAGSYNAGEEPFKPKVDAYKPKVDAYKPEAYKPKVDAYKPEAYKPKVDAYKPEAYKPNVDAYKPEAYKPKVDAYKPEAYKPRVDAYKPKLETLKPEVYKPATNNVFKPKLSGLKKEEEKPYRPNINRPSSDTSKWYDDSNKK